MKQLTVTLCLTLVMAGCVTSPHEDTRAVSGEKEQLFADAIAAGIVLNAGLSIEPGGLEFYAPYGSVHFFVINHTGYDLCFENDAFGVQGFVFNEVDMRWEDINLGFTPLPPGPRCVRNGATDLSETWGSFPTQWMDTKGHSEVRLLVVGFAATGERYGAYTDVRIIKGGTVPPTPTAIVITPFLAP